MSRKQIECFPEVLPRDESKIGWEHEAKSFPPYAYGKTGNAALIHKVIRVKLRWYELCSATEMQRRVTPGMMAETACGRHIFLEPSRGRSCRIPKPDAVLCNRCHGKPANFPRGKPHEIPASIAKVRLGCIPEGRTA